MSGARGRPVELAVAPADPRRERVAAVAHRLGIPLVVAGPDVQREGGSSDARGVYVGSTTIPDDADDWYVEAALLRAIEPTHILFLCVANSARSQLAEGIARSLVAVSGPGGGAMPVKISSAGSEPTSVRPQAVAVLREIGIDISDQRSNGMDDVEGRVDAVVTLCAEEVCPVWLDDAVRVHWGLPDPAGAGASEEEHLQAFRDVRDELRRRLGVLFTGRPL